ncbi:Na+/H+ antiporter NhaC family protein [Psychrobium sp. 1_MG-2023]|uniref:Na+/H+ antiporter NhaC family protein n=1 Tax=Psychrobium sp. 1_MG-2023 TaxID=3062624 RepID=UPI000C341D51|nr:Na+/H+ antiporter NhaC family protein [Psychrobium sp. 1_MG-2023]MDP2559593.1 Na+/H+ antiporter NhaC family protein [Psychrobium sp. 1_MG-2023]PKF59427.1 sodium:proton antiporter [Alteromonadales bacterium alter-6D02]
MTPKPSPNTANGIALLPLLLFLTLFLGTGTYLTMQGVEYAFYQLPAPIAVLPALFLALVLSKDSINNTIEQFIAGIGNSNVIAMCLIYLLAGGFAAVASATGGVDATVNLGLSLIPSWFLLPGFFLISAFIATAMGTSMGTLGAVAPIALGVAETAHIDLAIMAGAVISGAMFGDNLSIISDTTIAATRSQGCDMRDKFKENLRIAVPAALVVMVLLYFLGGDAKLPPVGDIEWLKVLPYLAILGLAVSGVNVFVVLASGIMLAGGVGLLQTPDYSLMSFSKDIYKGFSNMQEIFILSMFIGGLGAVMSHQGGLAFIVNFIDKLLARFSGKGDKVSAPAAELGIAGVVGLTNLATANNTVSIIVASGVAKDLAQTHQVEPKRSASLLDIFACCVQGLLPYGAQALMLGAMFKLSPLEVSMHVFYPMLLAVSAILTITLRRRNA